MGLLYSLIVGILAGYLASIVVKGKGSGCFVNLIVGAVGSIIGFWLFDIFDVHLPFVGSGFIGTVLKAFFGAVVLLAVVALINRKKEG